MLSLEEAINDMIDYGVPEFKLRAADTGTDVLIPYMMNDALEYYYVLKNAEVPEGLTEEWLSGLADAMQDSSYGRSMLHLAHEDGSTLILRYDRADYVLNYYQYHRIHHFWLPDHHLLRQLSYWVQTMADKWMFVGDEAVNAAESQLLRLAFFGPLRFYSPYGEDLSGKYPDYIEGSEAMLEYAKEAGDASFAAAVEKYLSVLLSAEKHHPALWPVYALRLRKLSGPLSRMLCEKERLPLIRLLVRKVEEASSSYPERSYDAALSGRIEKLRRDTVQSLYREGWSGAWPLFEKDGKKLLAAEEHPFTVPELDYEDFSFSVRLIDPDSLD